MVCQEYQNLIKIQIFLSDCVCSSVWLSVLTSVDLKVMRQSISESLQSRTNIRSMIRKSKEEIETQCASNRSTLLFNSFSKKKKAWIAMLEYENFHHNFWSHHKTSVLLPEKWSEFMISARTHICQWAQKKKLSYPIDMLLFYAYTLLFFSSFSKNKTKYLNFTSQVNLS